jgi:hypothetical protein
LKTIAFATLAACALSSLSYGSAFQNGDFESPGGNSYVLGAPDPYVTGWIHDGAGFEIYTQTGGWGIPSHDGSYYIAFGHNTTTGGTLSQTFDTTAGNQYVVNYWVSLQQNTTPSNNVNLQAFNATNMSNLGAVDTTISLESWTSGNSLTFVAGSGSTTIRFTDTTSIADSGPVNWGLDSVTVSDLGGGESSAAPEPATWALLSAGFAVFGLIRRRRS